MRSHISVHGATTKYFSNSFVFKTEIEREGLPRDSPAGLGAGVLSDRAKSSLVRNRRCAVVSLNPSLLRNLGATRAHKSGVHPNFMVQSWSNNCSLGFLKAGSAAIRAA
jgi:hypothetical protein